VICKYRVSILGTVGRGNLLKSADGLDMNSIEKKLTQRKQNWLGHAKRMKNIKQLLDYRSVGRRKTARPLNRLLDGYKLEAETGHLDCSEANESKSLNLLQRNGRFYSFSITKLTSKAST
jgi:hypothetical protein